MGFFGFIGGLLGFGGTPSQRIDVQKSPAASGLQIIYGRRRVEPVTVFKIASEKDMAISNTAAYDGYVAAYDAGREGEKDEKTWLHRIDVWGQGEITDIERFWIDGDVSTAKRFQKRPYFRAASKFGTEGQMAAGELVSGHSEWGSTHKGAGVAYTWSRFFNSSKYPEFTSEPRLNALVKGLKLYDPRDAGQSFSDPSTWGFSTNRALIILNYLMAGHGFGAGEDDLDLASFAAAADVCDEAVTIPAAPTNTSGQTHYNYYDRVYGEWHHIAPGALYPGQQVWQTGTTRRRFTADAVIDPKQGLIENIKKLAEGMGWALPWSNGKLRLVVEHEGKSAVMAFDEDSIIGGWTIERGMRADRLNRMTVEFANANKDYEQDTVSWPKLDSATYAAYRAEDAGQELHESQAVHTITNFYAAQSYAEYLVRKSRVSPRISGLKLAAKALLLEPGDVISLTSNDKGFDEDLFLVEKVAVSADLDVSVDLIAYEESVYDPSLADEEPLGDEPYGPEIWEDPTAITDIELTASYETNADGGVLNGLSVSWDAPTANVGVAYYELYWRKSAELPTLGAGESYVPADFDNSMLLTASARAAKLTGLVDDTDYTVALNYTNGVGKRSDLYAQEILLGSVASKLAGIEDGATRTTARGEYDDQATYVSGDIVFWEGGSYIFIGSGPASGVEPDDAAYWQVIANPGTQTSVFMQASAPATGGLDEGSFWVETDTGELYILTAGSWELAANTITTYRQSGTPSGAVEGDLWYDTNDHILYRYSGSIWSVVGNNLTNTSELTDDAGLGTTAVWRSVDGRSAIAFAINEQASTGNYSTNWLRFFGFDAATGLYPDRTEPALIIRPDGSSFTFGGSTSNSGAVYAAGSQRNGVHYLVADTSGNRRFDHSGTVPTHAALCRSLGGSSLEYYRANTGWVSLSHDSDMVVIGFAERRGNKYVNATLFEPTAIADAPEIHSLVGVDTPDLLPVESLGGVYTLDPSAPLSAADVGSSATISVAATTLYYGITSVSYNSGSITNCAFSTVYHIFASDPTLSGGPVTYIAETDRTAQNESAVYFGSITTPANGGGGTSGYPGGAGGAGGTYDENYNIP